MRLIFFDEKEIVNEENMVFCIFYYLTAEESQNEPYCENYGLFVELFCDRQQKEAELIKGITPSFTEINEIALAISRNTVTPSTLKEVVIEYIS